MDLRPHSPSPTPPSTHESTARQIIWQEALLLAEAATGAGAGGLSVLAAPRNVRAGLGELDGGALVGADAVADVGDEHVGGAAEGPLGDAPLLGGADLDGRAVHVHLAVAAPVEPGPGEQGFTGGGVAGQGEGPARVAGRGAAADEGVEHLPGVAAVGGERGLAAAAAVRGVAGDRHAVLAAGGPGGGGLAGVGVQVLRVVALAGEVAAAGVEGRADVVVDHLGVGVVLGAEGRRALELHVGAGQGSEAEEGGDGGKLHGDCCWLVRNVLD